MSHWLSAVSSSYSFCVIPQGQNCCLVHPLTSGGPYTPKVRTRWCVSVRDGQIRPLDVNKRPTAVRIVIQDNIDNTAFVLLFPL